MSLVTDSVSVILALLEASVAPLGFEAYVGNPAGQGDLPQAYAAAAYGGDDRPGIVGARDGRLSYGNDTVGDRWLIWVTISKASGDPDPLGLLADVEAAMDAFDDALEANPTLDGLLKADGKADLGSHEWTVEDDGTVATVFFQVDVTRRW